MNGVSTIELLIPVNENKIYTAILNHIEKISIIKRVS